MNINLTNCKLKFVCMQHKFCDTKILKIKIKRIKQ